MKIEPLYYSKKEVCTLIGKAPATLDRWEKDGMFPKRKVPPNAKAVYGKRGQFLRRHNCRVSYLRSEIEAWIAGTWKTAA